MFLFGLIVLLYYCDSVLHAVFIPVCLLINLLIIKPIAYDVGYSISGVLIAILMVVTFFVA